MKKLIVVVLMMIAPTSFGALSMKPGLWTIETKMKRDGKEYDPQAQIKAAMAKMSPAQKKQMEAMMAKMGHDTSAIGMSEKGMQVCFTGETLKNEEFLNPHQQRDCETSFPVKTSTRVVTEFKCKGGSSGTAEWNVKDSTHYNGFVKMTDKNGVKSEINYLGTFVSADCGKVKPIESMMLKKAPKK